MGKSNIIELDDVSFKYEKQWVMEQVNVSIEKGQFVGLIGPNGSGKTTLVNLILGLIKPSKGRIHLFNEPINQFTNWKDIGYVSQKSNSFNTGFPASVLEVVKSGLVSSVGMFRFLKREHTQQAMEALRIADMEQFAKSNIGELSGGQQQRVFIARALVRNPSLLILDEPTVGIDEEHVTKFYEILGKLTKQNDISLLMITHDLSAITEHATHVAYMNKTIHFFGTSNEYNQYKSMNQQYGYMEQQHTPNRVEVTS
ncbi:metal ABC transporter ATP-binding protein [Radiobacillus kanasensis]|uniref:metal ABC transporter ATP-binding protein n=1 Tax=Radiobacillus kanasensis TaxID=2844358 RepID=UPI001E3840CF|nr:metal ABC transporter ATP-binding protein [Radiobacillus kanasensis]UFT99870.1 metal ABC transporter ATP-binding protein [Radiobacillus kanasensis]